MSEIKLTRGQVIKFIQMYKRNECLWNSKSPYYKRLDLKNKAWLAIAHEFNTNIERAKKKAKSLRSAYLSEKKKVENSKRSLERNKQGDSAKDLYQPSLFYFDELRFIDDAIIPRKVYNDDETKSGVQSLTTDESIATNCENNVDIANHENISSVTELQKEEYRLSKNEFQERYDNSVDVPTYPSDLTLNGGGSITYMTEVLKPLPKKIRMDSESPVEEFEIFGRFIALEMRNLKNEASRKKLKRRIMQAILEVGDEDDGISLT